jgi:hypothetical protein
MQVHNALVKVAGDVSIRLRGFNHRFIIAHVFSIVSVASNVLCPTP